MGQAMFGEGSDQVWARDLQCIGTEKHLLHCPALYPAGYRSKCTHNMDAGVICPNFHYCECVCERECGCLSVSM